MTTVVIIGVILGVALIGGAVFLLRRAEEDALTDRINEYAAREEAVSIEDIELSLSLSERIFVPIARRLGNLITRFAPQEMMERTAKQLESAGKTQSAAEYWASTVGMMIVVMLMGLYIADPGQRLLYGLGGAATGFILMRQRLTSAVRRRKELIIKKLPDAVDLMTICVDAGLTFDGAMSKVNDKWDDPLSREFGRVVYELQLGKTRRQALRDMSERLDVPDVQSFIASVLQADQLGVGMGRVLKIQSEQMRVRRRQRAEEKAQQAPIKMLFPMVFLIFPSMFVVLLGPAGFRVYRIFYSEDGG
jgi:tight adherence protein C